MNLCLNYDLKLFLNLDFKDFSNDMTKIWQVDITPTLALLFDVPIPKESIGVVLFPLLNHLSVMDQLAAVYKNALHLAKLYVAMFSPGLSKKCFVNLYVFKYYEYMCLCTQYMFITLY